jgi:hypothetical protein
MRRLTNFWKRFLDESLFLFWSSPSGRDQNKNRDESLEKLPKIFQLPN